jgi:hypothetical protein
VIWAFTSEPSLGLLFVALLLSLTQTMLKVLQLLGRTDIAFPLWNRPPTRRGDVVQLAISGTITVVVLVWLVAVLTS